MRMHMVATRRFVARDAVVAACRPVAATSPAAVPAAAPAPAAPAIRVVSYNILANKYAVTGNHAYCPPTYLDWSYRFPRILQELQQYNADILCLQEVEAAVYHQQLVPVLQRAGYTSLYQPRAPPEPQQQQEQQQQEQSTPSVAAAMAAAAAVPLPGDDEGISLHFKDSMFEQVHVEHIRFADYASACVPPSAAAASRKSQSLTAGFVRRVQGRLEGAILALLRHKPSQRVLLVSNTHLYWSPDYPDVKAAQASILCAAIASLLQQQQQRLQAEGEQQEQEQQQQKQGKEKQPTQQQQLPMAQRVPVVCAGDFNSLWRKYESDRWDQVPPGRFLTSGVYQILSGGHLPYNHPDHPHTRSHMRAKLNSSSSSGGGSSSSSSSRNRTSSRSKGSRSGASTGFQNIADGSAQPATAAALATAKALLQAVPAAATVTSAAGVEEGADAAAAGVGSQMAAADTGVTGSWDSSMDEGDLTWDSGRAAASGSRSGSALPLSLTVQPLQDEELTSCTLRFVSANYAAHGREPAWTNRTSSFQGVLDYIWLSHGDFEVVGTLEMPYLQDPGRGQGQDSTPAAGVSPTGVASDAAERAGAANEGGSRESSSSWQEGPIPDRVFPSDHLAIGCDLVLLPLQQTGARVGAGEGDVTVT